MKTFTFAAGLTVAALASGAAYADADILVLLCKGIEHCPTCGEAQRQLDFDWTYTVNLSSRTVDGFPATISNELITWQLKGTGVLDQREISRYSKKFHFAATPTGGGPAIYYGDGTCEAQKEKAF